LKAIHGFSLKLSLHYCCSDSNALLHALFFAVIRSNTVDSSLSRSSERGAQRLRMETHPVSRHHALASPECSTLYEGTRIMNSRFIASAVVAATALASFAAFAQSFNPYLWDQMKAPSGKTRAQVKAELQQAPQDLSATAPSSADHGVSGPQKQGTSPASKPGITSQTNPLSARTGGQ
jgi:hypothetical protein